MAVATKSFAHAIPGGKAGVLTLGQVLSNNSDITLGQSASATTSTTAGSDLEIKITNSALGKMYAYIMGNDFSNGKEVVYQNGANGWYYPTQSGVVGTVSNNLTIEIGANSDKTLTLTESLNSGWVYIGLEKMTFMADELESCSHLRPRTRTTPTTVSHGA